MITTDPRFDSLILGLMLALAAAHMVLSGAVTSACAFTVSPADVFINEITTTTTASMPMKPSRSPARPEPICLAGPWCSTTAPTG